jgi:hypothetical protein
MVARTKIVLNFADDFIKTFLTKPTKTMKTIIEQTPITLPNDYADVIEAYVYSDNGCPKLTIGSLPSRIADDYRDDEILKLWANQYPEWNETIFTNN